MAASLNYARLKELGKDLGRPLDTITVTRQDPFMADLPARRRDAEWFATLWERFSVQTGAHLRRVHYLLVSQPDPVLLPNGEAYANTDKCADLLNSASLDARYLGLVDTTALVDRRNAEPYIYAPDNYEFLTKPNVTGSGVAWDEPAIVPPRAVIEDPGIAQTYSVEIWCEKSTMNDVLLPLAEQYGANVVTGSGELSLTHCSLLVDRAEASLRPVRLLYVSDFDPAGKSMPVAVARKIEFLLQERGLDLDIQVRPVMLTEQQCEEYELPRTPIKATEGRAERFERRYGEGATELDALEALHPGELRRILEEEILRYYDPDLDDMVAATKRDIEGQLDEITEEVHERHAEALEVLETKRAQLVEALQEFEEEAAPVLAAVRRDLVAAVHEVGIAVEWPEPQACNEDSTPLFDSTRDYLNQIEHYKVFQDKPAAAVPPKARVAKPYTCDQCGKVFLAKDPRARTCSPACRTLRMKAASARR
jgi:hypothetical protein